MQTQDLVGKRVKQVRAEYPEFEGLVGREATVTDAFEDTEGQWHARTDDEVWCPVRLLEVVPQVADGRA